MQLIKETKPNKTQRLFYAVDRLFNEIKYFLLFYCHLLIHAEIYIYIYWIHTDAMIKTHAGRLLYNVPLTLFVRFEKVIQGLRMRGSWRPNRNCNILTPNLWPSTLCLSRSPDAQPEAQRPRSLLDDGFLYCILSASSLDPNSSGPQAPSAWCGFSYHTCQLPLQL